MKIISDLEEIEGKTIQKALFVDVGESFALIFDDDTYAIIDVGFCGDSHELELLSDIEPYLQMQAGIISEDAYLGIQENKAKERQQAKEYRERDEYERLKKIYDKGESNDH